MEMTNCEKQKLLKEISSAMEQDLLHREDAVAILDVLIEASHKRQEEIEKSSLRFQGSDVVQ